MGESVLCPSVSPDIMSPMKKLLAILSLGMLLYGCTSTVEPTSQINNPYKSSSNIKIMSNDENHIKFIATTFKEKQLFNPTENLDWVNTAKKYCSSKRKNTYLGFKPKQMAVFRPIAWDRGYEQNRVVYRFICAKNYSEAKNILNSSTMDRRYWAMNSANAQLKEYKRIISSEEIADNAKKAEEKKIKEAKIKKEKLAKKIASLELNYKKQCINSNKYEDCLFEAEKKYLEEQKALDIKLASMSPKERHMFNCSEVFNFRKGTEKFNDCVFKLYTAELDVKKLELEKQVAEAKAKAAANEQARAEAIANAQIAAAKAAKKSADLNRSLQLMQMGSSMLGGSSSSSSSNDSFGIQNRVRTTCRNVGGFINCY